LFFNVFLIFPPTFHSFTTYYVHLDNPTSPFLVLACLVLVVGKPYFIHHISESSVQQEIRFWTNNTVLPSVPTVLINHPQTNSVISAVPSTTIRDTDFFVLQSLFDATNGNEWYWLQPYNQVNGYPWNFTDTLFANPCNTTYPWQGVTCELSVSEYVVISIRLQDYGLDGKPPRNF
jgi:hypothetical protein